MPLLVMTPADMLDVRFDLDEVTIRQKIDLYVLVRTNCEPKLNLRRLFGERACGIC